METMPLYRIEVAPLVILSLSRSPYFTYTSTVPIKKGSLVSLSFGKQTVEGIVFECHALPGRKPSWMKEVSFVIQEAFLTETQRLLAEKVSTRYFSPLGKTLRHFVPNIPSSKKIKEVTLLVEKTEKKITLRANQEEQSILKKILTADNDTPLFLDTSSLFDPKKILLLIAKETAQKRGQVLIIVPEIILLLGLKERFLTHFQTNEIALLHSKLAHSTFFSHWERIRTGEARVILATRHGLFAPFHSLETIIVTEEQDESYKQWDMSPRYHGKRVAEILAKLSFAKLILTSSTPSAESILCLQEKKLIPIQNITLHPPLGNALTIVNLKLERYRKNFSPLSEALTTALQETLSKNEQALLYINRQGLNAFSICDQCKNVFRCAQCDHPLTNTQEGYFRCVHCGWKTSLFPHCVTCNGLSFRHIGFGTEKIEKEVLRLFPKAKVVRLDSTTLRTGKTLETIYHKEQEGSIDILIGTQMVLKDPPLPSLSLVAMIDADSLLLFPDFQADERLFQDLSRAVRQIQRRGKRAPSLGKVFVQTFRPESAFLGKATRLDSGSFMKQTLREREELFYPPFSQLITLTCQEKTEKATTKKSTILYDKLKEILPRHYRLHSPSAPYFLKKQQLFQSTLLLRFPAHTPLNATIQNFFISHSKDYTIDVDPTTLR